MFGLANPFLLHSLAHLPLGRFGGLGGFGTLDGLGLGSMSHPGMGLSFNPFRPTPPSTQLTSFNPSMFNTGSPQQQRQGQRSIPPGLHYPATLTGWPGAMNLPALFPQRM